MSTLQKRISELVEATGWSVGEVAAAAGVSSSAVSQWLGNTGNTGKVTKSITLKPALLLERKTGFSALWLSDGTGPKRIEPAAQAASLNSSLRLIASSLASMPKLKRDGVKAYLAHLIEHCEDEKEVAEAIALIESAAIVSVAKTGSDRAQSIQYTKQGKAS